MSATVRPTVLDVARAVTALDDAYFAALRDRGPAAPFVRPRLDDAVAAVASNVAFVFRRGGFALHSVTARDVRAVLAASGASGVVSSHYASLIARRVRADRFAI